MVELCAIASGSNGNCYYIGTENEAILVDVGINAKQVLIRMENRGLSPRNLKAILITHEHTDHISGMRVLSKRLNIPVYCTFGTLNNTRETERAISNSIFKIGESFQLGSFMIHPFAKNHDAIEPCSYRIEIEGLHVGVMTDIGSVSTELVNHFNKCHAVFLETNYDEKMLWEGSYPYILKRRVASDYGHLSNSDALNLIKQHPNANLSTLFLSHLSGENNTPEIAYETFSPFHNEYRIITTSRKDASQVVRLNRVGSYFDERIYRTCKLIIPDFNRINDELIAYFAKNPDALYNLKWRKFEELLSTIFKNQGFITELGPGSGDGGVDIRLIQKDNIGELLTLVQAKKYSPNNPIKLEAVSALYGVVESQNANRGLFVTTSRFLPSAQDFAKGQEKKLILANSIDIAKWCQQIQNKKR